MRLAAMSIVLTKAEAARRHIEAAIAAFDRGLFDVAITLAAAAEGMAPDPPPTTATLFKVLRDHPRVATAGIERKDWINCLNQERDWLKHNGTEHPMTMAFNQSSAAIMVERAISIAQSAFGFQSGAIEMFRDWVTKNVDFL